MTHTRLVSLISALSGCAPKTVAAYLNDSPRPLQPASRDRVAAAIALLPRIEAATGIRCSLTNSSSPAVRS